LGLLGLDEVEKPPALAARGGCWFRGHGLEVHIGIEDDFAPARRAHPGFLVHGLEAHRLVRLVFRAYGRLEGLVYGLPSTMADAGREPIEAAVTWSNASAVSVGGRSWRECRACITGGRNGH